MIAWILIGLIVLAVLAVFLHPLLAGDEPWSPDPTDGVLAVLRRRRDRILRALKDLEQERETGLIDEAEYDRLRGDLRREGADALRDLERVREARQRKLRRSMTVAPSVRREIEGLVEKRKEAAR